MDNERSPQEVLAMLSKLVEEHPNARIVADVPCIYSWDTDHAMLTISGAYYEPDLTFARDDDGKIFDVYYSRGDFFQDYGDEPVCDFEFGEYIIVCCDRK